MIRNKILSDISQLIRDSKKFEISDFKIDTQEKDKYSTLSISFVLEPAYKLFFVMYNNPSYGKYGSTFKISCSACPGELTYKEQIEFSDKDAIYDKVKSWLGCIWEEISSNSIVRALGQQQDEIRQQVDEMIKNVGDLEDTYFTNEEAEVLKERLDELSKKFQEQIENSVEDANKMKAEITSLQDDIQILKQTIQSYKKQGWIKSFTTKAFKWANQSDNKALLKEGAKMIQSLLIDKSQ